MKKAYTFYCAPRFFEKKREMLKNDGLFEKLDTKICIGQGYRGKTGKLGVGACTCKFEHNVNGCPPTENQIYDFLKQYILNK